jgi:hypothetical protein
MLRRLQILALCGCLLPAWGCRSTRMFAIDSDSRVPWFGLNLSLPRQSAKRKTLETISDTAPTENRITTAELRETVERAPAAPVRSRLPAWLGGSPSSLPLPSDAPRIGDGATVTLEGPREEFR